MAVGAKKGLRVNYLIIFLGGLVFLIAGILIFLLIIQKVYGNFEIEEVLPTKDNLTDIGTKSKAAVLYSKYTENMLPEGSTWLSDNIDIWENYLQVLDQNYDIISDKTIEKGEHWDYEILILPGAKSLSDKELVKIKKYIERGGSVFATSGVATFSDEGKWRGWEFFNEAFGMDFNKEVKPKEKYKVHTLRGNLPLTAGIPAGYELQIATWDRPIYAEVLEPRTTQVSFWFDYKKEEGLVMEQIKKSAGIAYGTYGKGRFVWSGFELSSVIGVQEDYIYFEKLLKNSLNWLTYAPIVYVKDWPKPYESAAIFTSELSKDISNVQYLTGIIDKYDIPATFFVNPYTSRKNQKYIKMAAKYGDIGAIVDVGYKRSGKDTVNKLMDKETQINNLIAAKDTLESIVNKEVTGFMPLYGFYNKATKQAMSKAGYDYLVTDSLTDRSVPNLEIWGDSKLVFITKTARDDNKIIKYFGLKEKNFQKFTYKEDVDRLKFEKGLYVLKAHSQYQMKPQYVDVLSDVIQYLRDENIWLTSISEINEWWKRWRGLEITYDVRSKRRVAVEVNNLMESKAVDFVVQLHFNKKVKNVELSSNILYTDLPEYEFDRSENVLYLYVKDLNAGDSRKLLVDFENIQT